MEIQLAYKKYQYLLLGLFLGSSIFFATAHEAQASLLRKAPNNLGLAGYWSFEDGKGTTLTDFSGQGNMGTLTNFALSGSTSNWITGKRGKGLSFDGSNDYVSIGGDASVYGRSTNLSIFAWIKTTDTSWEAFSSGEADDGGWGLVSFSSIGGTGQLTPNVGNNWRTSGHTNVSDGQWHHVGYTLSSASGGTLQFYLDGAADGSAITSAGSHNGSGSGIRMGSDSLSQFNFNGEMDEARFYTRALTSAEVAALYADTKRSVMSQANQSRLVTSGLGGFWSFNEADVSGTTAYDRAGSANGTLTNGPTATQGRIGQALSFDGSNDYVTATNNVTSNGASRTISAWIYPNSVANSEFVSLESSLQSGGPLALFGLRSAVLSVYHGGDYRTAATALTTGRWYHAVYTYDSSNNAVKLYLNANQDYSNTHADAYGGSEVHIGVGYNGYFNGKIDEVRLYSRALTAAEVAVLYHGGRGGLSSSNGLVALPNLVLWHTFDGPHLATSTVADRSGQGNNGTLAGPAGGQVRPRPKLGKIGQALNFDGTDDYVVTSYQPDLTKPLTVSFWAYYTTDSEGAYFSTALGSTGGDGDLIRSKTTGDIRIFSGGSSADFTAVRTPGVWSHIVYTNTAVSGGGAGVQTVYVNGVSVGTAALSRSTDTAHGIEIGNAQNGSGAAFWTGTMDDLRVYNKALSAEEVLQLYNLGK